MALFEQSHNFFFISHPKYRFESKLKITSKIIMPPRSAKAQERTKNYFKRKKEEWRKKSRLRTSGDFPTIGLGTYALGNQEQIKNIIKLALEEYDYKHIDCAEFYGNEKEIGIALKEVFNNGKIKREDVWITSKLWNNHHSPEDVEKCCRNSIANLQADYLDLYLIHWPCAFVDRPDHNMMPFDENGKMMIDKTKSIFDVWIEMQKLVDKGLVRNIGVSNFSIELLERFRFDPRFTIQPYCNQVEYNLYMQQEALRRYCEFRGIYLVGYSPLGSQVKEGFPNLLQDPVLLEISKETGHSPAAINLRFLLQLSRFAVVLPKTSTPERLKENNSLDFNLTEDQMERLKGCERCFRFINDAHDWNVNCHGDDF